MAEKHESDTVVIVNRLTRNKMSLAAAEVEAFLKKHKLYEMFDVPTPEDRKSRKKAVPKKAPTIQSRKRALGEDSVKSSPSSRSESYPAEKRVKQVSVVPVKIEQPVLKPSPLLVVSLEEMQEIVRMFTSCPPGCADWNLIAKTACGNRLTAIEVEYLANEFVPHVHYRPSIGLVVMERVVKQSEFTRHKHTLKRMRHGLPIISQHFKDTLNGSTDQPVTDERIERAIERFQNGEVPIYAIRTQTDENLTATGREKKRYETKAIRLAKAAATLAVTPVPKSVPKSAPAFFFSTERHFSVQPLVPNNATPNDSPSPSQSSYM